jgi:hypothetical protein
MKGRRRRLDLEDRYSIENIQKMTPSQRVELKAKWAVGSEPSESFEKPTLTILSLSAGSANSASLF